MLDSSCLSGPCNLSYLCRTAPHILVALRSPGKYLEHINFLDGLLMDGISYCHSRDAPASRVLGMFLSGSSIHKSAK